MISRIYSVFWKEWMGLRAVAFLFLLLFVIGLAITQVVEMFDSPDPNFEGSPKDGAQVIMVLTVVATIGLAIREKTDGTLKYLDGLPVPRGLLYVAKTSIVFAILAVFIIVITFEEMVYFLLQRDSLSGPIDWRSEGIELALTLFVSAFFVAVMMPLSFLRRWTLLALGGLFWAVIWMKSLDLPNATLLDPFELFTGQGGGDGESPWFWPVRQLVVLSGIAAAAWLLGLAIFSTRSSYLAEQSESWWRKVVGVVGIVAIVGVWIGIMVWMYGDTEESLPVSLNESEALVAPSGDLAIGEIDTSRFTFVFRERDREKVTGLADEADAIYTTVAEFLEFEDTGETGRIFVELLSPLGSHNAGQAHWKKIRMTAAGTAEYSRAILGHEVTHVLIDQLTDERLSDDFNSTRWFHEGLADYVEHRFFKKDEDDALKRSRRSLALASSWGEVDYVELIDDAELTRTRDPFLVYAAGRLWVKSLISLYGDEAPATLLRAVVREDAPRKLSGLTFWRDLTSAAGYDLEWIRSEFRSELKTLRAQHEGDLTQFPEITEAAARRDRERGIVVAPEFPEGLEDGVEIFCRARPAADAPPYRFRYESVTVGDAVDVSFSPIDFFLPQMQVQFGVRLPGSGPTFGEWVTIPIE